ncbi:hypothetical protein GOODEAATRI_008294, partial [Goodea atripinnis]
MLRRFTREKEEITKRNPNLDHLRLAAGTASKPQPGNSTHLPLASNSTQLQGGTSAGDLSLTDLTSDPTVMSLLGSTNEKELQDLLGDLDFNLLDTNQQHAMVTARENGILGIGVPSQKAVGGSGQGRSLGSSSGLFSPPPLPDGLPAPLIKRIEDLRAAFLPQASRQFDQEGRKKFFTLDMNNILLDIELQVQEQPPEMRSDIYSHMETFVPCNKEALLKRLKKLSLNIQVSKWQIGGGCGKSPGIISFLFSLVPSRSHIVNVVLICYGETDRNDEPVLGMTLLCNLVRVKLSCYEMENQCTLSVEDYLKAFLENEVKPLWPKGWMQTRVRRRVVPGPKAKAKEGLWINKPPLTMTSTPAMTSSRQPPPPLSSPPEPICLSDSLDEDLTAPSLDSISHALALLSNASKGLGPADSPMSPPPLQMPTSSPPPVAPHYPAASQLSTSVISTLKQHSLSKVEPAPPAAVSAGNLSGPIPATPSSTSSSSSPVVSSMARLHTSGLSLTSRTPDGHYGHIKGSGTVGQIQTQRHVTMATPCHRPTSVVAKMHPHPSPSPPKLRPPPTASPLLPPHQKGFTCPAGILGTMGATQGVSKSSVKSSGISSNGSALNSPIPPSSSPSSQSRSNSTSHCGLQSFCPPSPATSSPYSSYIWYNVAPLTGSPLLSNHSALPLGFGMLGGLVPVSLPFQFPPLLSFSAPGAAGAASMGSTPSSNSGYTLAQSDLMGWLGWPSYALRMMLTSHPLGRCSSSRRKRAKSYQGLATRVEQLPTELAEMKSLLQTRHSDASLPTAGLSSPPMPDLSVEENVLSLAASASQFRDEEEAQSSQASETGSFSSQSAVGEPSDGFMREVMCMALRQLQLELPLGGESASGSAFFRHGRAPTPFSVPPSEEYLRELHLCWRDPRALSCLSTDGQVLAAMHESVKAGLDRMPVVEPAVASLIVSPDEALRPDVQCPRTQCRVTDDLLCKAYNAGARAGRLGNFMAHLMFALSASLQDVGGATAAVGFSDAAFQAFALMTRELVGVMSFLVQACRQVWLAQSPLIEACRRTLRGVPVMPSELFASEAVEVLKQTVQAPQTSQQLSGLRRSMPPPP